MVWRVGLMRDVEDVIRSFDPIGLDGIGSIQESIGLLNRHETKFALPAVLLPRLLLPLLGQYQALDIQKRRVFGYENLYFDTPDSIFYLQHHNQKLKRYKLRFRRYSDINASYWEVKIKISGTKNFKARFAQPAILPALDDAIRRQTSETLENGLRRHVDRIRARLWVNYSRMTLASPALEERITIDTDIHYAHMDGVDRPLNGIVIAELKQKNLDLRSPFVRAAKDLKIYATSLSKYCTGVALLEPGMKRGRFKTYLRYLQKMNGGIPQ